MDRINLIWLGMKWEKDIKSYLFLLFLLLFCWYFCFELPSFVFFLLCVLSLWCCKEYCLLMSYTNSLMFLYTLSYFTYLNMYILSSATYFGLIS